MGKQLQVVDLEEGQNAPIWTHQTGIHINRQQEVTKNVTQDVLQLD